MRPDGKRRHERKIVVISQLYTVMYSDTSYGSVRDPDSHRGRDMA